MISTVKAIARVVAEEVLNKVKKISSKELNGVVGSEY